MSKSQRSTESGRRMNRRRLMTKGAGVAAAGAIGAVLGSNGVSQRAAEAIDHRDLQLESPNFTQRETLINNEPVAPEGAFTVAKSRSFPQGLVSSANGDGYHAAIRGLSDEFDGVVGIGDRGIVGSGSTTGVEGAGLDKGGGGTRLERRRGRSA